MENTTRMRLIIAGLFLAAVAAGYLIFSQFRGESTQFQGNAGRPIQQLQSATPSAIPTSSPAASGQTSKGGLPKTGASSLPATGVPAYLVAILGASAAIIGWGLRQYPK